MNEVVMIAVGLLAGAGLLALGGTAGYFLGRRRNVAEPKGDSKERARDVIDALSHWTDDFSREVAEYRQVIDKLAQEFQGSGERKPIELIAEIAAANERLQSRLNAAEENLEAQARDLAGYYAEARTDALTMLPNRRAFDDALAGHLAELGQDGPPVCVMLIDVDYFKRLNDRYGHLAGDCVLAEVARTLQATVRGSDVVARYGGEEFVVVLPCTDLQQGSQAAERARFAVEHAVCRYETERLAITVSCGVAQAMTGESADSLVKRADEALYTAKKEGRNRACRHVGEEIELIPRPATARDPDPNRPATPIDDEFQRIRDDLRRRLERSLA